MPKKKTWIWILVSLAAVTLVGLIVVAIAGMVFVTRHISTTAATAADAQRAFEVAKTQFKDQRPLIELDNLEQPRITRRLSDQPTAAVKPAYMWILVWDDRDERLVKVSLPFWLLRLGRRRIDLGATRGFDLERLNLDMNELERVGPTLILEHRLPRGERVLIWTQ
jgi:hypothetical protein